MAELDGLWDKFLSSPLLAEKGKCNCGVTVVSNRNQNIQGKPNEVAFKKLENTRPSLSESLATLRPKFIKQSQLRATCTHKQGTAKSKKPCLSEEEKEKRRKSEIAENRLRVKLFQKEVLDPLHSSTGRAT